MDHSENSNVGMAADQVITNFIQRSPGLQIKMNDGEINILQKIDNRSISFASSKIEEVLSRQDSDGRDFLQVNFLDGRKILITERLVGFKPAETAGLDLRKLPKVVTTPDLVSVVEAIEESVNGHGHRAEEIDVLRRVFDSVLNGAEAVGFEVGAERNWLNFITNNNRKASC
ncbi:MAG: hypothetical protein KDD38_10935 [Bdellovibrionales bacterium]|nr:hypothetical protein [Bdellovibrionales bacterium]